MVERYRMTGYDFGTEPYSDGAWVTYHAYAALERQIAELRASPPPSGEVAGEPDFATSIAEVIKEEAANDAACGWISCSGCHETNEGAETGHYPYSKMFGCFVGSGCSECGGLGVVWEYWSKDDLDRMQDDPCFTYAFQLRARDAEAHNERVMEALAEIQAIAMLAEGNATLSAIGRIARAALSAAAPTADGWRTMESRACSLCGATDRCDACNEVIGVAEALPSRSLTDRKWLDPECGKDGCQSLVWKGRYQSAVKGRRGFREALRSVRQSWKIAEDALASISGEKVPQRFPARDLAARALREARSHFIPATPTATGGR